VVVAIVLLLAALLLPALKGARDKAKAAFCVNNLKQLATAYALYGDFNQDVIGASPTGGPYPQWLIDPYLGIQEVWVNGAKSPVWDCPANPSPIVVPPDVRDGGLLSYVCNSDLWYDAGAGLKRSGVRAPERKFLMIEHDLRFYDPGCTANLFMQPPGAAWSWLGHNNGMNVAFCDYHVEWLPASHPGLGAWNLPGIYAHWSATSP